jgi:hypothetical protein
MAVRLSASRSDRALLLQKIYFHLWYPLVRGISHTEYFKDNNFKHVTKYSLTEIYGRFGGV